MKTDRELLELAAKAAGIEWYGIAGDDSCECLYFDIGPDDVVEWNPLTDDGDALRLAVNLQFATKTGTECSTVYAEQLGGMWCMNNKEQHNGDPYAATRRCITRAAAEIGASL
jgi:Zn-dependent M28 family amino/carboxypeptidase